MGIETRIVSPLEVCTPEGAPVTMFVLSPTEIARKLTAEVEDIRSLGGAVLGMVSADASTAETVEAAVSEHGCDSFNIDAIPEVLSHAFIVANMPYRSPLSSYK